MKKQQFELIKTEGNKEFYSMTDKTIKMNSIEMNNYHGLIRGMIEHNADAFGTTKVGVKVGKHTKFCETFLTGKDAFEVMNDLLTEVILENNIKFI